METPTSNRRQNSRVLLSASCTFGSTEDTPRSGTVTSLSHAGCFVKTRAWAERGLKMFIKIWLPGGGWLPLRATVIYHMDKVGFGLAFEGLTQDDESSIDLIMREAESSPEPAGAAGDGDGDG